jgi:hypothetical protein
MVTGVVERNFEGGPNPFNFHLEKHLQATMRPFSCPGEGTRILATPLLDLLVEGGPNFHSPMMASREARLFHLGIHAVFVLNVLEEKVWWCRYPK